MRRREMEEAAPRPVRELWVLILGSLLAAALVVGGGAYLYFRSRTPKEPAKQAAAETAPDPQRGSDLSYPGTVQARHVILVPAPVDGTMEAVEVEVGGEVFESQVLGRITNTSLEAARDLAVQQMETAQGRLNNLESGLIAARLEASRSQADAARARTEADRTSRAALREQNLYKEGATARLKMEKAVKEHEAASKEADALTILERQARDRVEALVRDIENARRLVEERTAALEEARTEMEAAQVVSPGDGVLLAARVKAGEEVNAAMQDLFQIGVDLQEMQVTIEPEPPVLERIKAGMPALVEIIDYSRDAIEAEVGAVEGDKVRIHFIAPDPAVKPGMSAVVKLKLP